METIRDIRVRLKSIDSTKQITESMRMISTRKVQRTKTRMEENRIYSEQSLKTVKDTVADYYFGDSKHAYIAGHDAKDIQEAGGKPLILVITGDRGLCGGYNINASKEAVALAQKFGGDADFISIGSKGRDYLRRRGKNIIKAYRGLSESPFHKDALNIGGIALDMYNKKSASEVHVVYTAYHTMLSQTPKSVRLLPLDLETGESAGTVKDEQSYETDADAFFEAVAASYVHNRLFSAMLESAVCEQCSKLTSMDSAVKNSEKIIDALTLQYNQMRQSAITQEIAEIVGGANAVEK